MRILFCVDDFKGGAGNVIQLLSIELKIRNHHIAICCLGGTTPGRHPIGDIPVYRIPSHKNLAIKYSRFVKQTRDVIKQEKPDCVVSFLFGVSSFVNLAMLGMHIPHIVSERSDPNYLKPSGIMAFLTEMSYKRAKNIVVLFDDFKNISNNRYIEKTITIPNPVPSISLAQTDVNSTNNEIRFVTIANDTPPKGLDLLVAAFTKTARNYSNIVLRIYGKESRRLSEQIQKEGMQNQIFLMGYTLDIEQALSWADVYVMPSRHEGFPNSLCEAMSAGKCCIATLCHSGIKEIIEDGKNGLIAKEVSVEALAERISFIMENTNKIKELGNEAKVLSAKYDMDNIVIMWEELINNVIKK